MPGNVAKQKSAALPRADDSGQYCTKNLLFFYLGATAECLLSYISQVLKESTGRKNMQEWEVSKKNLTCRTVVVLMISIMNV